MARGHEDVSRSDPNGRVESFDRAPRTRGSDAVQMQYDPGPGDYTKERRDIFADLTIDTLLDAIKHPEDRR